MNAVEHRDTAQEFLAVSAEEFADGKTMQASEKLWGAAAHAVISIAQQRGWRYGKHQQLVACVNRLYEETGDADIRAGFSIARQFHANFYHDFLEDYEIEMFRPPVATFVNRLTAMDG